MIAPAQPQRMINRIKPPRKYPINSIVLSDDPAKKIFEQSRDDHEESIELPCAAGIGSR